MALIYATHLQAAALQAARALHIEGISTPDIATIGRLQDDLAAMLGRMVESASGVRGGTQHSQGIPELARHPVWSMARALRTLPPFDSGPSPVPPSDRWSTNPEADRHAAVPVWQDLVRSSAVAAEALALQSGVMTDGQRWVAVGEVAALAEALATSRSELLERRGTPGADGAPARRAAATLGVAAREVARMADAPSPTTEAAWLPPRPTNRVTAVSSVADLTRATRNLTRLLVRGDASIGDVLAVGRVLAQTSRAAGAVLDTVPGHETDADDAFVASVRAGYLAHADHLAQAVTTHRAVLGSLTPGSRGVRAQGRELGTSGLLRLRSAAARPSAARAAEQSVLTYVLALPDVSHALRDAADRVARDHSVAIRDRSDNAPYPWRMATQGDLTALVGHLSRAVTAAVRLPRQELPVGEPRALATGGPTAALRDALSRRRVALRPATPAQAAFGYELDRPRSAASR